LPKRKWTDQENEKLRKLVMMNGPQHWAIIAKHFEGRVAKQCRARWFNHLSPDVSKEAWTEAEDAIIYRLHKRLGNQWSEIAKSLAGRTGYGIKNRYNGTIRRLRSLNQSDEPLDVDKITLKDFLLVNHCAYGRSRLVESPRNKDIATDILEMSGRAFSPHKRPRAEPAAGVGPFTTSHTIEKGQTKTANSALDTLAAVVGLQNLSPGVFGASSGTQEPHGSSSGSSSGSSLSSGSSGSSNSSGSSSPDDDNETGKLVRQIELIKYFQRQCMTLQSKFQILQQQQVALQEQYRVHFGRSLDFLNPISASNLSVLTRVVKGSSSK